MVSEEERGGVVQPEIRRTEAIPLVTIPG